MELEKAIKNLELFDRCIQPPLSPEASEAVKLGIEALKREKANRDNPDFVIVGKLPSETEE